MQIAELEIYNVYQNSEGTAEEEAPGQKPSDPIVDTPAEKPQAPRQEGLGKGMITLIAVGATVLLVAGASIAFIVIKQKK